MEKQSVLKGLFALLVVVLLAGLTGCEPQLVTPQSGQAVSPLQTPPPSATLTLPTATPTPAATPTPPLPVPTLVPLQVPPEILTGEKIAFLKDKDVWLINVASRAQAQATTSGNVAHLFGWSHDGSQLLIGVGKRPVPPETDMPGGTDLWVVDIQSGQARQLTQDLEVRSAAWSPGDNQIAYVVRQGGLYVANSDGTNITKMVDKALAHTPAWSPDGMKIAFILPPPTWEGGLVEKYDIAVLSLADGSIVQLTSSAWTNFHPIWSLDGQKILFESDREHTPDTGLWYVMNADGSRLQHLEKLSLLSSMNVDRSPIADQVAFEVEGNIWVMDFDGNALKVVEGSNPSWSPDGSKLIYVGKDSRMWIINVDGTGSRKLSEAGGQPHWSK